MPMWRVLHDLCITFSTKYLREMERPGEVLDKAWALMRETHGIRNEAVVDYVQRKLHGLGYRRGSFFQLTAPPSKERSKKGGDKVRSSYCDSREVFLATVWFIGTRDVLERYEEKRRIDENMLAPHPMDTVQLPCNVDIARNEQMEYESRLMNDIGRVRDMNQREHVLEMLTQLSGKVAKLRKRVVGLAKERSNLLRRALVTRTSNKDVPPTPFELHLCAHPKLMRAHLDNAQRAVENIDRTTKHTLFWEWCGSVLDVRDTTRKKETGTMSGTLTPCVAEDERTSSVPSVGQLCEVRAKHGAILRRKIATALSSGEWVCHDA